MSASSPPTLKTSRKVRTNTQASESSAQSKLDWLENSLLAAKTINGAAQCAPFPYVQSVFGAVVILLETVEKMKKNRDDLKELCEDIVEIITIVRDQVLAHGVTGAVKFKADCMKLKGVLEDVLETVSQLKKKSHSLRTYLKEVMKLSGAAEEISKYQMRIQTLRSNFILLASIDTNFKVDKIYQNLSSVPKIPVAQTTQSITNCPPPSRIFHGRQEIRHKMHKYFTVIPDQQHIFLLYGLGGAGKTQIALKFIQEASAHFSDIFLIDASTTETIDTALKNMAITRNIGNGPQEALRWLSSRDSEWLLFFDNADDPNINLSKFFPKCTHGNILITSRNPELRVHAAENWEVSNMEEADAIVLLLKSARQDITPINKEVAAKIVKVLWYLPLAIIQAGAFIAKSEDLGSYLKFYTQNKARLLSEQPAQSHDDYTWTVYTTWQISFDRLSEPAATFLRLCSHLHHEGISEGIFARASTYKGTSYGPPQQELAQSHQFLSHFCGDAGDWNSFYFKDMINEIRGYSLITFHQETKLFSMHPLVHDWCQSAVPDPQSCHHSMVAILGMSIAQMPQAHEKLASIQLLPHMQALLYREKTVEPDFAQEYGVAYFHAGKSREAEKLQIVVLEKKRGLLGEEHPDTLTAMNDLAKTYFALGQLRAAEKLQVVVLERRRELLGEDNLDTLNAMSNLATTYFNLGQLKEAENLRVIVLEKRRRLLGEDHLDTLIAMNNLAYTYSKLGQLKAAEKLQVVVLEKRQELLGQDHPNTLTAMNNLAITYMDFGQFRAAEKLRVVVLEKRRELLGEEHPETLTAMSNLAYTYSKLGQVKAAEKLQVVLLGKRKELLGEEHPNTLLAMNYLAETHFKLGQSEKAESLQQTALQKLRRLLGEDHPYTLTAMDNLANIYCALGQVKDAEELGAIVLNKRKQLLGEEHPHTLSIMNTMANIFRNLGRLKQAEELGVVGLEKQRRLLGDEHPATLQTMANLALTYYELNRLKEAAELQVLVLENCRRLLGEEHPDTLTAIHDLDLTSKNLEALQKPDSSTGIGMTY